MKELSDFNICIVGLGLIGGSMAMALDKMGTGRLTGVDIDPDTLSLAREQKVVHDCSDNAEDFLGEADIVIISLYPESAVLFAERYSHRFKSGALVTDVCGLKQNVVRELRKRLPEDVDFIGGHPMAGREHYGLSWATPDIFRGANYILTPQEKSCKENVELLEKIIYGMGFRRVVVTSAERHDSMIALTSQLPHLLALSIALDPDSAGDSLHFSGNSFRHISRLADFNVPMWAELLYTNRENLLERLDQFIIHLEDVRQSLLDQDNHRLTDLLAQAAAARKGMVDNDRDD